MCEIENITARQILDSRGNPTVEVDVVLADGSLGRASVPSGASKGIFEAKEIRDNVKTSFCGKGVLRAVDNVNTIIAPNLIGEEATNQQIIDSIMLELDGSYNKSILGANAVLPVSLAVARASAKSLSIPLFKYLGGLLGKTLPMPMMNILNGGRHANNLLDIQEFMIVPVGMNSFSEALKAGVEIFHTLKSIINSKGWSTSVGDEGGFTPNLHSNREAIELVINAIEKSGYNTNDIQIALDIASSELYTQGECSDGICCSGKYTIEGQDINSHKMIEYLECLVKDYPIYSIEDGLSSEDKIGWQNLTLLLGEKCLLIGDDIFVTNARYLKEGIDRKIANAVLIKPNQIGTLTETIDTILMAQQAGYKIIVSHRSGETEDNFIADLAVATNCGFIKTGSLSRTERTCKYNQLLRIEELLGSDAKFRIEK